MGTRRSDKTQKRAHPVLRVFAGAVALPFIGGGVFAAIAEFPIGVLTGGALVSVGIAAALYAWRGRQPSWFVG